MIKKRAASVKMQTRRAFLSVLIFVGKRTHMFFKSPAEKGKIVEAAKMGGLGGGTSLPQE
jgi:hypothetical protein